MKKKIFWCKVGIHKYGRKIISDWAFRSNVRDCKKKCVRCGHVKKWVEPKPMEK